MTIEANFRTNWRCVDFLAEANLENGNADVLLTSLRRSFAFLSAAHQQQFLRDIRRSA